MAPSRTLRLVRMAAAVAWALPGAACESAPPPVLGVSTSGRFVDAARMALSDAGERGELGLDTIMVPDRTNESAPAVRTAGRFVAVPGIVAVVGHSNSAASLAASQIYNQHRVVQIAPSSSAVVYSRAGPWSFRLVPPDDAQARFLADQVARLLPEGGDVGVLYVNDDYGRGLLRSFTAALDRDAHTIVLAYPHTEEEGDRPEALGSTLGALRDARPDLIVWLGRGTLLHLYLRHIRETVPGTLVLGSDGTASAPQYPNDDGRWDGVRYVDFVDLDATPPLRDFARRYRERTGRRTIGPDVLTYDATDLVATAVAEGARSAEDVRSWLMSLGRDRPPHVGISGPIRFDEEGDVERTYVLRTVGDGG